MEVCGLVSKPMRLSREDLATLPGQIPDVRERFAGRRGRGVLLASVLDLVQRQDGVGKMKLTSADGAFSAEVDLEDAAEAVLVYELDGDPLPAAEGGPVRFFLHDAETCRGHGDVPCANVKNLGRIELTGAASGGREEA